MYDFFLRRGAQKMIILSGHYHYVEKNLYYCMSY